MPSKISLQVQNLTEDWVRKINQSPVHWVKLIDPPEHDPFSGKWTIGRTYMEEGDAQGLTAMGKAGAQIWFSRFKPIYLSRPWVVGWESVNEPNVDTLENCRALVSFEVEFARLMHGIGKKVIGACFSTGRPDETMYSTLAPLFPHIDGCGVREYSAPVAQYAETWYVLRYRRLEAGLRALGVKLPPVYVGEGTIDGGMRDEMQPEWAKKGYLWFEQQGITTRSDTMAGIKWADAEYRRDPNVKTVSLFGASMFPPWGWFDLGPLWDDLNGYLWSQVGIPDIVTPPVIIPAPVPVPVPEPGCVLPYLERPLPRGKGTPSRHFGERPDIYKDYGLAGHEGLDYSVAVGTNVLATHAGVVQVAKLDPKGAYGLYVRLRSGKLSTVYAHLSEFRVPVGTVLKAGDVLGLSGNTGRSTGPHLHWGLQIDGWRNPAYKNYIDPEPTRR